VQIGIDLNQYLCKFPVAQMKSPFVGETMQKDLPLDRYQDFVIQFASSFVKMDHKDFVQAKEFLSVVRLDKGDFLCSAGEPFEHLCFVAQGLFKSYFTTPAGVTWIRSFSAEGQAVGPYGSILLQCPSSVSVEAIEDSVVVKIKHQDMLRLYERGAVWERLGRLVAEDHYRWWDVREFELMVLDAETRYLSALKILAPILDRITQRDLAQYIGITAEALSRVKRN